MNLGGHYNLSSILEKLIFHCVFNFLQRNNIIEHQYGYRSKQLTKFALIDITEIIRKALDKKKFACGIFVDLQ